MADAKFEEVIRLAFETAGTEGIKQAAGAIASMGDVSEEARQKAAALLDDIGNVEKSTAAVRQYRQVGKEVLNYQQQISAARTKVVELDAAVKASDAPTKTQQRELAKARTTLSELVGEQQNELATLRKLKSGLAEQGISTKSAAAAQKDLAANTAKASANLRAMVSDLKRTHDAEASLQAELSAAAQKSKAETEQYDAALKKVQKQLDANKTSAHQTAEVTVDGFEHTRSVLSILKTMLVSIAAYTGARGIFSGIKSILSTGDQFAKFQLQLQSIYNDGNKGRDAFNWVKQFAKTTPLQLDQVMQAFIQLKNFGIDPMNGALQAAVDQNAKLGGESERLQRITLAMGQAFAKGKLQGDDIKQMIEAGVPVWQLLTEVTGKSAAELQKMSEAGKITTDIMQKFFAQMGKDSAGASVDQMKLLSGQFSNLKDNIQQFEDRVSRKGVLTYFRDQLASLNTLMSKMADDGRLDEYAKKISDGLVTAAKAVKSFTGFLIDHVSAIGTVIKTYAEFKAVKIAGELLLLGEKFVDTTNAARATAGALGGVTKKAGFLGAALRRIPGSVRVMIAVAGYEVLAKTARYLADLAGRHSEEQKNLDETQKRVDAQARKRAEGYAEITRQYSRYMNTQVLGVEAAAKLTKAEQAGYKARLEGLQKYLAAKVSEQFSLKQVGDVSEAELQKTIASQKAAKAGMVDLAKGIDVAAEAFKNHLGVSAQLVRKGLKGIGDDSTTAQTRLQELFNAFQTDDITKIGDVAAGIASIGSESDAANKAVRIGLKGTLQQLSSTDLLKFQSAATAAFREFGTSAKDAASVTETVLQTALERLGVSADQWGLASTNAAEQNVAAFKTVAENASATAGAIEAAFDKAVANANTIKAVKELGILMQAAGKQGKVGFDATDRALKAVQDRIAALKAAVDPLADSFATLGIQSQRSLDATAAKAKNAFDNIVRGSRDGTASMNDVRAAFEGYSRAQLASVAHAEGWRRSQVKDALEVQASVLGVSDELTRMGSEGFEAGHKIARGAQEATSSLHDTAKAAGDAEKATEDAGNQAQSYAEKMASAHQAEAKQWVATGRRTQVELNGMSNAFIQALGSLNQLAVGSQSAWRERWNKTVAEWRSQGTEVERQIALLEKQNGAYDEMSKRVATLRKQYNYLNDDQLRALAQAQQTLEQNQKAAEDAAKKKLADAAQARRDAAQANADANAKQTEQWNKELGNGATGGAAAGDGMGVQRHQLDLRVSASPATGALPAQLSPVDVQKIANEVVRVIGIARTSSNR